MDAFPYSTRKIIFEPTFDLESFRNNPHTELGYKILNSPGIKPILKPPNVAYPRIVRAFYETFVANVDEEDNQFFTVTIDGQEFDFTHLDIANALKIPRYKPIAYNASKSEMYAVLLCHPPDNHDGKSLRSSFLHEDMFMIDYFFRHLLCPIMHGNERPQYLWPYMHGVWTNRKLDIPALMIEVIHRVRTLGRNHTKPHKLVYPRYISSILEYCGFEPRVGEIFVSDFDIANYDMAKRSMDRLALRAGLQPPKRVMRAAPQEQPQEQGESSTRPSTVDREEYDAIRTAQEKMAEDVEMMHVWMEAHDSMNEIRDREIDECRSVVDQIVDDQRDMRVDMRALRKEHRENLFMMQGMARRQWGEVGAQEIYTGAQSSAELADQMEQVRLESRATARAEARARKARDRASSSRGGQGGNNGDDDVV